MSAESRVAQCPMGHGDCPSDCLNNKAATKRTNELGEDFGPFDSGLVVVFGEVNSQVGLADAAAAFERCAKEETPKRDSE